MTSMGSSEISVCKDQRIVQHSSTPRTSTSSPEAGGNGQPRRSPSVRFTKGKGLADDIEHLPSLTLKDANSLQPGQDASGKDSKSYVEVLEDRVNDLENRLQSLEFSRLLDSSDKGDESSERSFLNTEPHWMTWQEYLEPTSKASNILEVLIEKPHTNARRRSAAPQALPEAFGKVPGQPLPDAIKKIERIRIRSPHIISALQTITEQTFTNSSCLTVHRPFKLFIFYGNHIEDYVSELEFDFNKSSYCAHGERCKGSINLDGTPPRSRDDNHQGDSQRGPIEKLLTLQDRDISGQNRAGEVHRHPASVEGKAEAGTITQSRQPRSEQRTLPEDFNDYECKHEISEELLAQKESIVHLRALLSFMKEDMREIFNRHQLLRSSQSSTVAWIDLWHLFMVGDFVVSDRVSNSKTASLYRVAILPACDFTSSGRRTVKELKMRSDGPQQQVESVYGQESLSAFDIDLYYFDFDGKNYGCVEKRITIVNFEGKKKITDLPVYPLRFHNDPAAFKLEMLEKGNKFLGLSTTVTAHREYTGLSLAEPQEQIDSQVIVDVKLAYRKHPENAPKFGLMSWLEDAARIVTEACGVPGCTECFKDRFMMDDHRIDRQRTVEFLRANRPLLTTFTDSQDLTEEMILLLPSHVYGFVLRSRKWFDLDINKICPIERHSEGFEALILPSGVARLVEGLVQTHSPEHKPLVDGTEPQGDHVGQGHQVDLVRGKGKGLVILLHGAPGVGKTSTAECVADYTHKPLFSITCGDIGETAKEVEHNLEQNFSLAHRWGCVLLLDEADVFLQARDKEDMRRNSVVSVFLRVLEYYPGILFLTTNKVGHFDEAFKSRIHVSLYYPPLDKQSTMKIWKMNLKRLIDNKKDLEVDCKAIKDYAKQHYEALSKMNRATWNGRQIKNAFQTAIALAEFDGKTKKKGNPVLTTEHFEVVARASEGFDAYLSRIHGTDADRARREGQRDDDELDGRAKPVLFPMAPKPVKRYGSSASSSNSESEARERKSRKKTRKQKKKYESTESSSSEDSEEAMEKRRHKERKEKKARKRAGEDKAKVAAENSHGDDTSSG